MSGFDSPEVPPAYEHVVRGIRQAQRQGLLSEDQVADMIDRLRAKDTGPSDGPGPGAG